MEKIKSTALSTILLLAILGGFSSSTIAAGPTVKLNAGLQAEVVALGRDKARRHVTASLKILNTGPNIVFLALSIDPSPAVYTNTGGHFDVYGPSISGIAKCTIGNSACMGMNEPRFALPIQSWTQLDPGTSTIVNMLFTGNENSGPLVTFTANLLYRAVADSVKDDTLSDGQKRQQMHTMPMSFGPIPVVDEE